MLDRGALRGVKIGKEWRVSRAEMMRFVEGNDTKTPPVTASAKSEAAATLINKGGFNAHDFRRVYPALAGNIVSPLEG